MSVIESLFIIFNSGLSNLKMKSAGDFNLSRGFVYKIIVVFQHIVDLGYRNVFFFNIIIKIDGLLCNLE